MASNTSSNISELSDGLGEGLSISDYGLRLTEYYGQYHLDDLGKAFTRGFGGVFGAAGFGLDYLDHRSHGLSVGESFGWSVAGAVGGFLAAGAVTVVLGPGLISISLGAYLSYKISNSISEYAHKENSARPDHEYSVSGSISSNPSQEGSVRRGYEESLLDHLADEPNQRANNQSSFAAHAARQEAAQQAANSDPYGIGWGGEYAGANSPLDAIGIDPMGDYYAAPPSARPTYSIDPFVGEEINPYDDDDFEYDYPSYPNALIARFESLYGYSALATYDGPRSAIEQTVSRSRAALASRQVDANRQAIKEFKNGLGAFADSQLGRAEIAGFTAATKGLSFDRALAATFGNLKDNTSRHSVQSNYAHVDIGYQKGLKANGGKEAGTGTDKPLLIDLDDDGVEIELLDNSSAAFDFDGDGYYEVSAWAAADDGFFVIDEDGDGDIAIGR